MKRVLCLLLTSLMATAVVAAPPQAAKHPHTIEAPSGATRVDDYFWLRDDQRQNQAVLGYLQAENLYADRLLTPLKPLAGKLYQEFVGRLAQEDSELPVRKRGYWYYSRYEEGQDYLIHARRKGAMDAPEEVLLNVNERTAGKGYLTIADMVVSQDNQLLAWSEDDVGRNQFTLRFKHLSTGEVLPDVLTGTTGSMVWADDNRTVFYIENDPRTLRSVRVKKHVLGTPASADAVVYEEQDDSFYLGIARTRDDRFITISVVGNVTSEMRYAPSDDPSTFTVLAPRQRGVTYFADHFEGRWLIQTNHNAKNGKLVTAPSDVTARAHWQDWVAHDEAVTIDQFQAFTAFTAIAERSSGLKRIRLLFKDGRIEYLTADETAYSMALAENAEPESTWLRYAYSSLTTPTRILELNTATGERRQLKQEQVIGYDASNYASERVWVSARDGARVPVSLVYRKGYRKDGKGALFLTGYGSYGLAYDPAFDPATVSLLDRGLVYAIAHVRGGLEMGQGWYDAGKVRHKRNTFNDFVDVTHALVAQGWAARNRVAAAGGSAGGLLMGAVANQAAQDYRVMVAQVPFVDVVTTMLDQSIPQTTNEYEEWGNPTHAGDYEYMLSYSPYDNVRRQAYPALYVATGLWDAHVQYWEPAKWVAKLREHNTGNYPIVLRTDMQAGHGGKSGRSGYYQELAEVYAFVLQQLGFDGALDSPGKPG